MSTGYSAAWWIITFVIIISIAIFWTSIPVSSKWVAVVLAIILIVIGFVFFINWSSPYSSVVEAGNTIYFWSDETQTSELNFSSAEVKLQNYSSGQSLGTLTMNVKDVVTTVANVEISTYVESNRYIIKITNNSAIKVGVNITAKPPLNQVLTYSGPSSVLPVF